MEKITNTHGVHLCDYRVIFFFSLNFIASPVLINLNKWIYSKQVISSHSLVAIHFVVTFLFLILFSFFRVFKFKSIDISKIIPLAIIFCGFVVLTNMSLQYNTVGTSQIIKTMTTPCIILIQYVCYNKTTCVKQQLTMIPIIIGVFFNSYYDVNLSVRGVTYASVGVVVASVYQVWVGEKQRELNVNSMQLLLYQAPLSVIMMLFLIPVTVPLDTLQTSWHEWSTEIMGFVLLSGMLAWLVNLSIYWIIGNTSPVTIPKLILSKLREIANPFSKRASCTYSDERSSIDQDMKTTENSQSLQWLTEALCGDPDGCISLENEVLNCGFYFDSS